MLPPPRKCDLMQNNPPFTQEEKNISRLFGQGAQKGSHLPQSPTATDSPFCRCATSVPLFVTYGDISPRPGRICPGAGEVFPLRGSFLLSSGQARTLLKGILFLQNCSSCAHSFGIIWKFFARFCPNFPQNA